MLNKNIRCIIACPVPIFYQFFCDVFALEDNTKKIIEIRDTIASKLLCTFTREKCLSLVRKAITRKVCNRFFNS